MGYSRYIPIDKTNEVSDKEKSLRSNLVSITIAGFNLHFSRSLVDSETDDLILLDLLGPLEGVRGAWASMRNRKQSIYAIGGKVKMHKDPGHTIIKSTLPYGGENWTIVQNQCIPNKMRWDIPVYFWGEIGERISKKMAPANFLPAFKKSAPFPIKDEWSDWLWEKGLETRAIHTLQDYVRIRGFKLKMNRKKWQGIITDGVVRGEIS